MRKPVRAAVAAALVVAAAVLLWQRVREAPSNTAAFELPSQGPISLALTGDTLLVDPLASADAGGLVDRVRHATIGFTNLESNLLTAPTARALPDPPSPRWPFASASEATLLKQLGFDAVSLANNHAADYGEEGLVDTAALLDGAGILHAGAGRDLAAARAAATVGTPARGFALIALSTSSSEQSRATLTRDEIKGRPGLNPLRYEADITADPQTFSSLKSTVEMLQAGAVNGDALSLFGTTIRRGGETSVDFVVEARDVEEILDVVRGARAAASLVVVSIHSHEPSNASPAPAGFVERFAHDAIDAGASLVVGHGPHRVRGIELYGAGAIFYSLGNFIYQAADLDPRAADAFDAGADLYAAAIGALSGTAGTLTPLDDPSWWTSVLAVATFDDHGLSGIELYPADLGVDLPRRDRGVPRPATGERAITILDEVARLSAPYGTEVVVDTKTGTAEVEMRKQPGQF